MDHLITENDIQFNSSLKFFSRMKKVFANWKMSLATLLLVGGLMIVSNSAQAQGGLITSNNDTPDVKGAGTWVLEADALALLEGELQGNIATALETLPPSGQQYIFWKYKAMLFEAVHASIKGGINTSKAFRVNYDRMAGASHQEPVISALSQAEWQQIFNEMVDLLTN
jgi:hypothetical protein